MNVKIKIYSQGVRLERKIKYNAVLKFKFSQLLLSVDPKMTQFNSTPILKLSFLAVYSAKNINYKTIKRL